MKSLYSLLSLVLFLSCNQNQATKASIKSDSSKIENSRNTISRIDSLTLYEKSFLNKILMETEALILSNRVERFYAGSDTVAILNRLIFSTDSLVDNGYVYLELEFYGNISDVNISYRYSRGTADTGFGTVTGNNTSDYLHTHKSCGVSACITQVFQNGTKIFEKEE